MPATEEGLPVPLRRDRMAAIIAERGFVRVAELSRIFRTSPVTVRTDLEELAALELVRRIHGGAVSTSGATSSPTIGRTTGSPPAGAPAESAALGSAVARRLEPGSTIVLAAGPAADAVADSIAFSDRLTGLTIVTDALRPALRIGSRTDHRVVVIGGTLDGPSGRLVDPLADRVVEAIVADAVILCPSGVSAARGVTFEDVAAVPITQRFLACGGITIAVAGAAAIGADAPARATGIDAVDVVVTAPDARTEEVATLRDLGIVVEIVDPSGD